MAAFPNHHGHQSVPFIFTATLGDDILPKKLKIKRLFLLIYLHFFNLIGAEIAVKRAFQTKQTLERPSKMKISHLDQH